MCIQLDMPGIFELIKKILIFNVNFFFFKSTQKKNKTCLHVVPYIILFRICIWINVRGVFFFNKDCQLFLGMSLPQAIVFAQSSLIFNYCHHKLAKPNKSCFMPKERGTFFLSNGIKHHAT